MLFPPCDLLVYFCTSLVITKVVSPRSRIVRVSNPLELVSRDVVGNPFAIVFCLDRSEFLIDYSGIVKRVMCVLED